MDHEVVWGVVIGAASVVSFIIGILIGVRMGMGGTIIHIYPGPDEDPADAWKKGTP
jgi:hypothetical protein